MRITTDDGPGIDGDVKRLRGISQAVSQKSIDKTKKHNFVKDEIRQKTLPPPLESD